MKLYSPLYSQTFRESIGRLHSADAIYGTSGIALAPGILKTLPVYITKHVVLEKRVPVPEPVIIEKPYHVPVPIEKIVHKPVPIPIPVPQVASILLSLAREIC